MVTLSKLVHNLQLERGLSAGYIVSTEQNLKINLLKQYKITDNIYNKLLKSIKKSSFLKNISVKNQNIIFNTTDLLKGINDIRTSIIDTSIDFEQEINYYSKLNNLLILSIKNINSKFLILQNENGIIDNLLRIQEYAGLERAYSYSILLTQDKTDKLMFSIKKLRQQRKRLEENLLLSASQDLVLLYKKLYKKEIEYKVNYCTQNIFNGNFSILNAEQCFKASTQYIDMLDNIYQNILNGYVKKANMKYDDSLKSLYIIYTVAVISAFMVLLLFYILFKLINREEKNKIDLQIAAYTFEAREGVVITNSQGIILKVNKSFTSITGYEADETPGNTPRILKSNKHPESFYKNIWDTLSKKGQWQGEIINKRKNGEFYNEMLSISSIKNEDGIVIHYIAQFLDISEIKKAQEILQHQVDHDYLSGLLNKKALTQQLKEAYSKAKRHNLQYAFLFIDLDNFKKINDTYGHDIGDKLIVEVAKRMKMALREEDIVARLSGDEFGIIIMNLVKNEKEVEEIAEKLLKEISREMALDSHYVRISSSIGIKLFPKNNTSLEDIIVHADSAMYTAKKQGKNRFIFYKN